MLLNGGNFLGIVPEDVTRENMSRYNLREPRGVAVARVVEQSPAERAGLKAGDVILRFDNEAVGSTRKLNRLIAEAAPEQVVRLTISRNGREQEVSATLDRRRDFPQVFGAESIPRNWPNVEVFPRGGESFVFALGTHRRIGVSTTQLTKQLADYFGVAGGRGLLVTNVSENSPAAKAGIRAGDVITEADGQRLETVGDLSRAVNRQKEGEVTLTIIRDKSQRTIRVTPEGRQPGTYTVPEGLIAPQVGEIRMPQITIPVLPEMNLKMPRIKIPVMPRINVTVPRIAPLRIEPLPNTPLD
jgi:serine protease Do